ncbi:unnamed protein product [Ilex paraguariensis]|uniref:Uncharacterized protein n=1 Tax=Ilex paraguariensis TaxID=185542 RepID=A0ABC8UQV3_9AQUA
MSNHDAPKNKLEDKVAIITGGASGIGEETARLFAVSGVRAVVIADIQEEKGQQIHGRLDIMFSNAGVLSSCQQDILDFNLDASDQLFAINVRGMAACVKQAARAMVEGGVRGSIVDRGDVNIDYVMSKHAVLGLMRSASVGLGVYGMRVNSVSPAAVETPLTCKEYQMSAEEVEKTLESANVLKGGVLKVKHVGDAVLFLASKDSEFITGHNLVVDGGFKA